MIRRTLILTFGTLALGFSLATASAQQPAPAPTFCGDTAARIR